MTNLRNHIEVGVDVTRDVQDALDRCALIPEADMPVTAQAGRAARGQAARSAARGDSHAVYDPPGSGQPAGTCRGMAWGYGCWAV